MFAEFIVLFGSTHEMAATKVLIVLFVWSESWYEE